MSDARQPYERGCREASRGCGEVHVPVCWPLWGCGLENDGLRQKLELLEYLRQVQSLTCEVGALRGAEFLEHQISEMEVNALEADY